MRKTTSWGTYTRPSRRLGVWLTESGNKDGADFYLTEYDHIAVHPYHGLEGLFVTCHAVRIEVHALKATDLEAAKPEAVACVRARLVTLMAALDAVETT